MKIGINLFSFSNLNINNIMTTEKLEKIHNLAASSMNKVELCYLIFGKEYTDLSLDMVIPEEYWIKEGKYTRLHAASYVYDIENHKIINVIEEGINKGIIYKTVK